MEANELDNLFSIIFIFSIVCLLVGIIKPCLLIRWGVTEKRGRKQVLFTVLSCTIVLFIISSMTTDAKATSETKQTAQQTKEKAKSNLTLDPTPTPAPTIEQQLEIIARDTAQENFKKMTVSPPDTY